MFSIVFLFVCLFFGVKTGKHFSGLFDGQSQKEQYLFQIETSCKNIYFTFD